MAERGPSFVDRVRGGMSLEGVEYEDDWAPPPRRKPLVERVEESVTIAFFLLMFVTLVIGVFWRYVLNAPLIWTVNLGTLAFIWVVMIGSGLPNWDDSHIQFDLVYDRMSRRWQRWSRIVGNLIVIIPFAVAIPGTIHYLAFVRDDKVTGLPLNFMVGYGCVLVFLVATVLHRGRLLVRDLRGGSGDDGGGSR